VVPDPASLWCPVAQMANPPMEGGKWYLLASTGLPHCFAYLVKAMSTDDAIEVYCLSQFAKVKRFKNGRWRWGGEYYDSAKELLASCVDVSIEILGLLVREGKACFNVYCSIGWEQLIFDWDDLYMNPKTRVGQCYEWYSPSPDREYYALFRDPESIIRRFRDWFPEKHLSKRMK